MRTSPAYSVKVATLLALLAAGVACPLYGQTVLYSNNFSADTVGNQPLGGVSVNPATNTGPSGGANGALATNDVGIVVVDSLNTAGTGNAMRIYDFAADFTRINYTFTPSTGPVTAFEFNASSTAYTATSGNSFLRISFGTAGLDAGSSSSGSNIGRIVLAKNTGTPANQVFGSNNTSGSLSDNGLGAGITLGSSNAFAIFINDSEQEQTYSYNGFSGTLAADTYEVWLNGTLLNSGNEFALRSDSGATNRLAAISFATGGSQQGADWIIDDIVVTAVPEPGSGAMAALALSALAMRRRKARKA